MGVTPPPHGQGYYPWEGWPAAYQPITVGNPDVIRGRVVEPDVFNVPQNFGQKLIRDELDRLQNLITEAVEHSATEHLIEALRAKGYTVTPPTTTEGTEL